MKNKSAEWKAWEAHIKAVFPFSDAIKPDDLAFTEEYGQPVLAILGRKHFVKFVKNIRDGMIFMGAADHYPPICLTEQISLKRAEMMRATDTAFIDSKGNVFLDLPGIYLFVIGRRAEAAAPLWPASRSAGKLFKKSGIKLIYTLLADPLLDTDSDGKRLNAAVRDLAKEAGLSTGSVSELLSEMKERGFLLTDGRHRRLVNRKALFDQWLHGYMDYRFRMPRQCYKADSVQWWKQRRPEKEGFLWGGEPAGAILTDHYLRPEKLTVYCDKPLYDLVVDTDLHQVSAGGNVEFVTPLSDLDSTGTGCVHPLLVYADLICSSDNRNTETATRIYERYLRKVIEPD